MPVKSPIPDVDVPHVDIATYLFAKAQARVDALAAAGVSEPPLVIDAVSGGSLCFSEIKRKALAIARGVSALIPMDPTSKSENGGQDICIDRAVLVLMRSNVMYSAVHFGIMMTGCTHVVLDSKLGAQELEARLKEIGLTSVVAAFVDAEAVDMLESAAEIAGVELQKQAIFTISNDEHLALGTLAQENIDKPFMPYKFTPEETATLPALVVYSSGTSGRAKGIMLTHRNILAVCTMFRGYSTQTATVDGRTRADTDSDDIRRSQYLMLALFPPCHIYGHYVLTYYALLNDCCMVFVKGFEVTLFLEVIERYKITHISITTNIMRTLLHETTKVDACTVRIRDNPEAKFHIGSVINIVCSGSNAPLALRCRYSEYFGGAPVIVGYGQSESSSIIAGNTWGIQAAPGAVGVLCPNSVAKVIDANGNETDALSELCISGPHIMKGYAGNVKSPIVDGFLHTGDYARLSTDGHVYLHGRLADVVHTAQGLIIPTDVEAMLADNPAILDSAVVGVGAKGEAQAVVLLVLADSDVPKKELLADISQFIKAKTANPHIACREITNLPRNLAGKVIPHLLLEQIN
ncbi:hypothetical protein LPJ59_004773 [Coemansia sp. RSA 2399]|nr:hypothetical protein LPJ59_004773 [Coemansia sp. RSA 2399]KAJ1897347.1 hypothetical protein LPJ81_004556 [Coemansia sp. IMI 209127]